MLTNILTFPRLGKISIGIRPSTTSQKEEGKQEGEVSDCRVRAEIAKGEEGICKGKPVSGMMYVILGDILLLLFK